MWERWNSGAAMKRCLQPRAGKRKEKRKRPFHRGTMVERGVGRGLRLKAAIQGRKMAQGAKMRNLRVARPICRMRLLLRPLEGASFHRGTMRAIRGLWTKKRGKRRWWTFYRSRNPGVPFQKRGF